MAAKRQVSLTKIDMNIDFQNPEPDALKILALVRPDWKQEDIKLKLLSGGFINKMLVCRLEADVDSLDAVVVRVFQTAMEQYVTGMRNKEIASMVLANVADCFPQVYAVFNNGVVYGFAPGRSLEWKDLSSPEIIRKASEALAKFHSLDSSNIEIRDSCGVLYQVPTENPTLALMEQFLASWPEKFDDPQKNKRFQETIQHSKSEIAEEVRKAIKLMDTEFSSPKVICHADFHLRNIVYNKATGRCTLIDFEMVRYAPAPSDLKYLFYGKKLTAQIGFCGEGDADLTDDTRRMWVRCYLEACAERQGRKSCDIKEQEVETFLHQAQLATMVTSLLASVVAISPNFKMDTIPVNTFDMALCMYEQYMAYKQMILSV